MIYLPNLIKLENNLMLKENKLKIFTINKILVKKNLIFHKVNLIKTLKIIITIINNDII